VLRLMEIDVFGVPRASRDSAHSAQGHVKRRSDDCSVVSYYGLRRAAFIGFVPELDRASHRIQDAKAGFCLHTSCALSHSCPVHEL
jgi:hypothetical protein